MPLLPVSSDHAGIPLLTEVLIFAEVAPCVAEGVGGNDDGY